MNEPRVAFFADCFHEVNGVALTCRQLERHARRHAYPFCSVRAGKTTASIPQPQGLSIELQRGGMSIPLDQDFHFDPFLMRYWDFVERQVRAFRPHVIHLTGMGDIGVLGALLSRRLRVPVVGSWHTSLHEFASRRLDRMLQSLPGQLRRRCTSSVERWVYSGLLAYYRLPECVGVPNRELLELVHQGTGRATFLMGRGVDTDLYSPFRRTRQDGVFTFGYVGRLTPEKNMRLFVEVERALAANGIDNYNFLIVGEGGERSWLQANLRKASFPGVLRGAELATAYANMDVFLFPSHTDTFGNVVQEAQASAVPPIVTASGGPRFLVEDGVSGFIAGCDAEFVRIAASLASQPALAAAMKPKTRIRAMASSWEAVAENLWDVYRQVAAAGAPNAMPLRTVRAF